MQFSSKFLLQPSHTFRSCNYVSRRCVYGSFGTALKERLLIVQVEKFRYAPSPRFRVILNLQYYEDVCGRANFFEFDRRS